MTNDATPSLLEFPCRFPIKAMGRQTAEFPKGAAANDVIAAATPAKQQGEAA